MVLGLVEGGLPGGLGDDPLLSDPTRRTLVGSLATASERRQRLHHQLLAVAGAAATVGPAGRSPTCGPGALAPPPAGGPGWPGRPRSAASATPPSTAGCTTACLPPASGGPPDRPPAPRSSGHSPTLTRCPRRPDPPPGPDADGGAGQRAAHRLRREPGRARCRGRRPRPAQATRATALETWARCPFGYFVRHVLGVRGLDTPEEELSLRPADRGILVHAVLDVRGRPADPRGRPAGAGPGLVAAGPGRLAAELGARCAATEARGRWGDPALAARATPAPAAAGAPSSRSTTAGPGGARRVPRHHRDGVRVRTSPSPSRCRTAGGSTRWRPRQGRPGR